jgi:hypothetical protein
MNIKAVYIDKISEASKRLDASEAFLDSHNKGRGVFAFDAAVLQARKALEAIALAAIAPNRNAYEAFRAKAKGSDYRRDFNAKKILQQLAQINPKFYPLPLKPPVRTAPRHWHFERREGDFLQKQQFESFYDRLGKYLHSDNPWGPNKGTQNLVTDMPSLFEAARNLLSLHVTFIQTPTFSAAWVVEVPADGGTPNILEAEASGEFDIQAQPASRVGKA